MFLRGFREVIGLAVVIVGVYLVLNAVVIGAGLVYLADHPERFDALVGPGAGRRVVPGARPGRWLGPGSCSVVIVSLLLFPKLALGLCGFETGVAVMPLVQGEPRRRPDSGRPGASATRASCCSRRPCIMSVFLLGSSLVVSTLIEPTALVAHDAAGQPSSCRTGRSRRPRPGPGLPRPRRGPDRSPRSSATRSAPSTTSVTVVILWFAGASAMAGLLNLVPQYLPRYGMAPEWARAIRPLVILFTVINLVVTWIFDASVKAQGDAYATGVLVLMTSDGIVPRSSTGGGRGRAAVVAAGAVGVRRLITVVFLYTIVDVVIGKPAGHQDRRLLHRGHPGLVDGLARRCGPGAALPGVPASRTPSSRFLWDTINHLELSVLVPHRPGRRDLDEQGGDDPRRSTASRRTRWSCSSRSSWPTRATSHRPRSCRVIQQEGRYILRITNAASIAHTLAAVALELSKVGRPPTIHFGWTDESPVSGTLGFLLFGEGNVPVGGARAGPEGGAGPGQAAQGDDRGRVSGRRAYGRTAPRQRAEEARPFRNHRCFRVWLGSSAR